jgi:hypothetical protein
MTSLRVRRRARQDLRPGRGLKDAALLHLWCTCLQFASGRWCVGVIVPQGRQGRVLGFCEVRSGYCAAGKEYYGPDGVYPFGGHETARAFAKFSTEPEDLTGRTLYSPAEQLLRLLACSGSRARIYVLGGVMAFYPNAALQAECAG